MTIYNILIDYTTGNSFGSERIDDEPLEIITKDLSIAKDNLRRIKTHYEKYSDSPNYQEAHTLTLRTDEEDRTISPFWVGYFEKLHGAKIVVDDSDMSFEF